MKRKLDENDRPSSVAETGDVKKAAPVEEVDFSFTELGLDPRLLQAVAKLKFEKPTLVQRKAIPLALSGKDVLCKAKTGSGKTAAYVLPVLASILKRKQVRRPSRPSGHHPQELPLLTCAHRSIRMPRRRH